MVDTRFTPRVAQPKMARPVHYSAGRMYATRLEPTRGRDRAQVDVYVADVATCNTARMDAVDSSTHERKLELD